MSFDPYCRYRPIRLGIHVCAADDQSGETVTVCNYDLPSAELARMRFEAARVECEQLAGDDEPNLSTLDFAFHEISTPACRLSAPATPLPATLPLFAGGLGFVGYLAR